MLNEEEFKKFDEMIKKHTFTREGYNRLMHKFDFDIIKDFNMEEEYTKVVKKESRLSRRQRDVIGDMLQLNDMLKDQEKLDSEAAATSGVVTDNLTPSFDSIPKSDDLNVKAEI